MGLTRTFKGFDEEAFKIGFKKSVGWKESYQDVDTGDLKEVVCSDVPSYVDESEQVEIKKIGVTKRNPLKFIGAGKGKLTMKQLLNSNYFNVYKDLIEATLGKTILTVDSSDKFEQVTGVTTTDKYKLSGVSAGAFDNLYDSEKQVQLIVIIDEETNKVVDIDTIISNNSGLGEVTVAGALSDNIDFTGSKSYTVKALAWLDLDQAPETLIDFLIQRDSGFNFSNNPEFDGIYDGAETVVMKNAQGTVKFELPLQQQANIEYEFMTDDHNLIDPTPELLPATIEVTNVTGAVTGTLRLKRKDNSVIDVSFTDGGTSDDDGTAGDIATKVNALPDYTATATANVVTISSTNNDFNYTYLTIGADEGDYEISYNEVDYWKAFNETGNISTPYCLFDADSVGASADSIGVNLTSSVLISGTLAKLKVNGKVYSHRIVETDDNNAIATALSDLISNDVYTLDGVNYREIRYDAIAVSNTLTITATDNSEQLEVSFEIEDPTGVCDLSANILSLASSNALPYDDDDSVFFKLSKIKIGDAGSNMMDFCEVASLTINFQRDLKDIKSICSSTGRKGWNNTSYTLTFEVETTDIDAQRVYDKFDKYKNNKTFALQGVDTDSGFAFFFPACRFESFEKAPQDNLQGHKMLINVNFDPNKKPLLALHQSI